MKQRTLQSMIRAKEQIERGQKRPAAVFELVPDGEGGFRRRMLDPKVFQRSQKSAWDQSIKATRRKLRLSQSQFANLLGISIRTLHHWEQGRRKPTGAARVLLRIASQHPEIVLKAA